MNNSNSKYLKKVKGFSGETNPINLGLLACILTALALKFQLIFKLKIGWDEFLYLSIVHSYLREELTAALQSFHVHFFTWLPAFSQNEVSQILAARITLFFLFTGSCILLFLIGKKILYKSGALFSVLCYVSLSNIIFHGASFRADSIGSFLFLFSIYFIIAGNTSLMPFFLSGLAMALSLMISIKGFFHLVALGGVFVCLFIFSENKKQTSLHFVVFAVTFVLILLLLYYLHRFSLFELPKTGAMEHAGKAGSKVIMLDNLFPRFGYFLFSLYENVIIWILLLCGLVIITWETLRKKESFFSVKTTCLAYCFLIPLLTLLFYRNAFPYYYVFIMAPAIVFCGVIMHKIAEDFKKNQSIIFLVFAAIFAIPVFLNFIFHYSKATPDQLTAQKEIIRTVHEIFPSPVPYIDGCSVISSFPKVGFFMSTWGMENYLQVGKPVMADILTTCHPLFLVANLPSLDFSLPRENPFTQINHALLEEDWQILKSNFIHHWGPIYVAGKEFEFDDQKPSQQFEILIPGVYSIETKGNIAINGKIYPSGSTVLLSQGHHTINSLKQKKNSVVLRWGKNLYRPEKEPNTIPSFYGF